MYFELIFNFQLSPEMKQTTEGFPKHNEKREREHGRNFTRFCNLVKMFAKHGIRFSEVEKRWKSWTDTHELPLMCEFCKKFPRKMFLFC